MKCSECNSRKFEYDERLQQNCCVECGFVMVETPFEETVHIKYLVNTFDNIIYLLLKMDLINKLKLISIKKLNIF